jgi:hypothetical protein
VLLPPAVSEQNMIGACLIIKSPTCKWPQHIFDGAQKTMQLLRMYEENVQL